MTQKSPMIFSRSVPSGTVSAFVRLLTWMVRTVLPSTLKQTTSIPRVLRAVGMTFQPSAESL